MLGFEEAKVYWFLLILVMPLPLAIWLSVVLATLGVCLYSAFCVPMFLHVSWEACVPGCSTSPGRPSYGKRLIGADKPMI